MQLSNISITRRKLLGVGGAGALGLLGAARTASTPISYAQSVHVEDGGIDLRVAWTEWYNGSVRERQATPTDRTASTAPVLRLEDVVPGDAGKLAVGVTTRADEGDPPPARLRMRIRRLSAGGENGITEPEAKAGDATPDLGELGAHLDTTVWYDEGFTVSDTSIYGRCDGSFDPVADTKLISGPLTVVSVPPASSAWLDLDAHPDGPEDCLGPEEALCLGIEWALPEAVGNRIQSDTVAFAIELRAEACDGG